MSRLIARILLSVFIFPLGGLVYLLAFPLADQAMRRHGYYSSDGESTAFVLAGGVTWTFVAAYWVLLWRKSVLWVGWRVAWTFGAIPGAALIALFVGAVTSPIDRGFGCFVGSVTAPLLWLVGTIFVW